MTKTKSTNQTHIPDHDDHVHDENCSHHHHHHSHEPYERGMPKIGRNDPCFCGSGKKYKKCCIE
ncbi:MAG: hypothetical protein K0R02_778 [Rickettsiaceae bacterium]|jgi:uncharacterized protein YecA (UPF0149 family)|nr:hypothetical protein [Rickettsiaceae bacterium]